MNHHERAITPAQAALYGVAAGLTATVLISGLSRIRTLRRYAEQSSWRTRTDAFAEDDPDVVSPMSPATALVQASGPGPEGPAGLFAAKVASGLFGRDLATRSRQWGRVVHLAYGTLWGLIYGMLQTDRRRRTALSGVSHGLFVWAFGPALLVPAMKIMPAPRAARRSENVFVIFAHLVYGLTVAAVFGRLLRRGLPHAKSHRLHVRNWD
jgi:hypothetical protein